MMFSFWFQDVSQLWQMQGVGSIVWLSYLLFSGCFIGFSVHEWLKVRTRRKIEQQLSSQRPHHAETVVSPQK